MLSTALSPFWDILMVLQMALWPTIRGVLKDPSIMFRRRALARAFFANVWKPMGDGIDANQSKLKEELIRSRAHGVVLDIGAGYGHTLGYLDMARVSSYVAIEPNLAMHAGIRKRAASAGLPVERVSILPYGIEQLPALMANGLAPASVDCVVSILTLCSVPDPTTSIPDFLKTFMKPGGSLVFFEHVSSDLADARRWQRRWAPIWACLFDNCIIGRDTLAVLDSVGGWKERNVQRIVMDNPESLFPHISGHFVRED